MRIKSYFAPSVQSAISVARKEFGDDVTLVTSHTAALESRHLGDYEVVFAVEEPAGDPGWGKPAEVIKAVTAEPPAGFTEVLQDAIAAPLSTEENVPDKLEQVRTILIEMGIDAPMLRALMAMIERLASVQQPPAPAEEAIAALETPEPEPAAAAAPQLPDLTPAELAFYLSVSVGS